jgi:heme-degrading monooxygenase HmoA
VNPFSAATALEVVILFAPTRLATDDSLKDAWALLERASGYCGHQFGPCVEEPGRYVLLIWWRRIEDHLLTFRQSAAYERWKQLIDTHVDAVASVHHFSIAATPGCPSFQTGSSRP